MWFQAWLEVAVPLLLIWIVVEIVAWWFDRKVRKDR